MSLALTATAAAALLFAACGGDDDAGSAGGASGDAVKSADAGKTTDNGKSGDAVKSSGATGGDTEYVADICKAAKSFMDDLEKASKQTDIKVSEDPFKAFANAFDNFARDFAKAKPPKDLKDWHSQSVKALNDLLPKLKKGDMDALSGNPLPKPPQGAIDRLNKLAESDKNCKAASFDFNS